MTDGNPFKRADLRAAYEAARGARRAYEKAKSVHSDEYGTSPGWSRGWRDEERAMNPGAYDVGKTP